MRALARKRWHPEPATAPPSSNETSSAPITPTQAPIVQPEPAPPSTERLETPAVTVSAEPTIQAEPETTKLDWRAPAGDPALKAEAARLGIKVGVLRDRLRYGENSAPIDITEPEHQDPDRRPVTVEQMAAFEALVQRDRERRIAGQPEIAGDDFTTGVTDPAVRPSSTK